MLFRSVEFFNGFQWSQNLAELKFLLSREKDPASKHLLESDKYRDEFFAGDLKNIFAVGGFRVSAA